MTDGTEVRAFAYHSFVLHLDVLCEGCVFR